MIKNGARFTVSMAQAFPTGCCLVPDSIAEAQDYDERTRTRVHDLPTDEFFDGLGGGPRGPHVLDAPDDSAKLFERAGAAAQISG